MTQAYETNHEQGFERPHVLLMEDEISLAKGLAMVMREERFEVDWVDTGRSALDLVQEREFDLLVADLRLPDIDGMIVVEQIRQKKPNTGVVIITGYPSVSSAVQAVKIGVAEYLRKPFTEDEFMTTIKKALRDKVKASLGTLLVETQRERLIQREEVTQVLDRAYHDHDFLRTLIDKGSEALGEYQLSLKAKAAILSGDLNWINKHIGKISKEQLAFIWKRLEREEW